MVLPKLPPAVMVLVLHSGECSPQDVKERAHPSILRRHHTKDLKLVAYCRGGLGLCGDPLGCPGVESACIIMQLTSWLFAPLPHNRTTLPRHFMHHVKTSKGYASQPQTVNTLHIAGCLPTDAAGMAHLILPSLLPPSPFPS